jgi:hypothetical protein
MASLSERLQLLQRAFGRCALGKDGVNAAVRCMNPECSSRLSASKLKLIIKLDTEQYHCWVCGMKGGKVYPLFAKYAPSYAQDAKELFRGPSKAAEQKEKDVVQLPKGFQLLATSKDDRDPDIRAVFRYLHSRGIDDHDLWRMRLGAVKTGKLRRRVIFPSLNSEGELNYWVSRAVDKEIKLKYFNSKAQKKDIIFNECDINFHEQVTIVEGPFDLIKCDRNATCLLGSSLSKGHELFRRLMLHKTPVLLALDSDMVDKTHKIASLLYSAGCDVSIMPLGRFGDVGEMSKQEFMQQKSKASLWNPMSSLSNKISSIKSGSIL